MLFGRWFRMNRYQYENTRQYLRLPAAWPIKCEPKEGASGRHVTRTKDVSAGGVAIYLPEMIPVGNHLNLEIHVPSLNRVIAVQGQVVRCVPERHGGFALGIKFKEISERDRKDLHEAVQRFSSAADRARQQKFWWRTIT